MFEVDTVQKKLQALFIDTAIRTQVDEESSDRSLFKDSRMKEFHLFLQVFEPDQIEQNTHSIQQVFVTDTHRLFVMRLQGIAPEISFTLRPRPDLEEEPSDVYLPYDLWKDDSDYICPPQIFQYPVLSLTVACLSNGEDQTPLFSALGTKTHELYDFSSGRKEIGFGTNELFVMNHPEGQLAYRQNLNPRVSPITVGLIENFHENVLRGVKTMATPFDVPID